MIGAALSIAWSINSQILRAGWFRLWALSRAINSFLGSTLGPPRQRLDLPCLTAALTTRESWLSSDKLSNERRWLSCRRNFLSSSSRSTISCSRR